MKRPAFLLGLLATLSLTLSGATTTLSEIPFQNGPQKFRSGDSISIHQVLSTSPRMDVGDRVVVRGRYTLNSEPRANVGLSLTQTQSAEPTRISPAANTEVARGTGDFELVIDVQHTGCLHLTFSSLPARKSIGTVYFGTPEQLKRIRKMSLSSFGD